VNLMIVSVVVDLWYMSMSNVVGSQVISRSRKLMLLFCSEVGVSFKLGCGLFM
jgi:hypothetical protein